MRYATSGPVRAWSNRQKTWSASTCPDGWTKRRGGVPEYGLCPDNDGKIPWGPVYPCLRPVPLEPGWHDFLPASVYPPALPKTSSSVIIHGRLPVSSCPEKYPCAGLRDHQPPHRAAPLYQKGYQDHRRPRRGNPRVPECRSPADTAPDGSLPGNRYLPRPC